MMTVTVVVKLSRAWKEDEQREEKDFKRAESLSMHAGDLKHVKGGPRSLESARRDQKVTEQDSECKSKVELTRKGREKANI